MAWKGDDLRLQRRRRQIIVALTATGWKVTPVGRRLGIVSLSYSTPDLTTELEESDIPGPYLVMLLSQEIGTGIAVIVHFGDRLDEFVETLCAVQGLLNAETYPEAMEQIRTRFPWIWIHDEEEGYCPYVAEDAPEDFDIPDEPPAESEEVS